MPRSAFTASGILVIAVLWLLPGCSEPTPPPEIRGGDSAGKIKPMKGVEVYCWQEHGEKRYAALIGTNRLKEEKAIRAAAVRSLDELKKALDPYAEGTEVFAVRDRRIGELVFTGLASPAEHEELQEHCRTRGLKLE